MNQSMEQQLLLLLCYYTVSHPIHVILARYERSTFYH